MTTPKTLRVLAKGRAMVPNYEAQENSYGPTRSFLGRPHDPQAGEEFVDAETKQKKRQGAFVATPGDVVEVPNRAEYRLHVGRHKDLWPADQETADACGAVFDPTFGGEHPPEAVARSFAALRGESPPPPAKAAPPTAPASPPAPTPATPPSTATKGA